VVATSAEKWFQNGRVLLTFSRVPRCELLP
jgi:hypothetical protein